VCSSDLEGEMFPGVPEITRHQSIFEKGDALMEEIKAFLTCIENDSTPLVTGEEGRDALAVAAKITALIDTNLLNRYATI
jgi:predicted dehydrogenase